MEYKATLCGKVVGPSGKVLKLWKTKDGYLQFKDYSGEKPRNKQVGRFVYEYFHGPVEEGYVVDHINSDRSDNRINNLQKITYSENTLRGKLGKLKSGVDGVKKLLELGYLQKEVGDMLGLTQSGISKALKRDAMKKEGL